MSDQPNQETMREVARLTVEETFLRLGIDAADPIEMQRDFQHLREWRLAVETVKKRSLVSLVGVLVAGTCAALWVGVKHFLTQ